jgi:peptidoglycan/xylan/chitin deacetylase (PgdA/CDA1 family)
MSVTRGQFLKSLGASAGNAIMSTGVAVAAQVLGSKLATKMNTPTVPPTPIETPELPFLESGPAEGNRIALTFDDGPNPGITDRILDLLKERNLVASFFMIGGQATKAPELARRVAAEGHELCNHSHCHPKLGELPDAAVEAELSQAQETLAEYGGRYPTAFRPPFGSFRKNQTPLARKFGLRVVLWDVNTRDWDGTTTSDQIAETILTGTRAGSIILCHENHRATPDCLGHVLDQLLDRQFKFVRISEFI